jgi:hypothetical protein
MRPSCRVTEAGTDHSSVSYSDLCGLVRGGQKPTGNGEIRADQSEPHTPCSNFLSFSTLTWGDKDVHVKNEGGRRVKRERTEVVDLDEVVDLTGGNLGRVAKRVKSEVIDLTDD